MLTRFAEKINFDGPYSNECKSSCWEWTARKNSHGYGTFKCDNKSYLAHRWIKEQMLGRKLKWGHPIKETVNHKCHNRSCVRPDHCYLGTQRQNVRDAMRSGTHKNIVAHLASFSRTHCVHGHKWTPETEFINKNGRRVCRVCTRQASVRHLWEGLVV